MKTTDYDMSYHLMSYGYNFNDSTLFGICRYSGNGYEIVSVDFINNAINREQLNSMLNCNILPVFTEGDLLMMLITKLKDSKEDSTEVIKRIIPYAGSDKFINIVYNELKKHLK